MPGPTRPWRTAEFGTCSLGNVPIVIAHRGASGYLPEHTLPAKALAAAQGADYLEQDLAMTRDDQLVVIHDPYLDRISDVAERYPQRRRPDGHFYVLDFTMDEIRELRVTEPFTVDEEGEMWPEWPGRFPMWGSRFAFHTFEEELQFIRGLNYSTGRPLGIYTELKEPALHREHGKDIASAAYSTLKEFGYDSRDGSAYLQCFDPDELRRIKSDIGPSLGVDLPLIQLIPDLRHRHNRILWRDGLGDTRDSGATVEAEGMERVAEYADGIGPHYVALVEETSRPGDVRPTDMVDAAHDAGLVVHPYTVRADQLPEWAGTVDDVFQTILVDAGADGLFTDFPDLAAQFVARAFPKPD